MRSKRIDSTREEQMGGADDLKARMFSSRFLMGFGIASLLLVTSPALTDRSRPLLETAAIDFSDVTYEEGETPFSFCLDGDVMQQLLQGFGSERVANEVFGLKLNCGSRILREEIVGNQAVLDVELEYECIGEDADSSEPMNVQGERRFFLEL